MGAACGQYPRPQATDLRGLAALTRYRQAMSSASNNAATPSLEQLGSAVLYFVQRCTYLDQHPEIPPPAGAPFAWGNREAQLYSLLTGALFDVWARAGGMDLKLGHGMGGTVELTLTFARSPVGSPGYLALTRLASGPTLKEASGAWEWALRVTGASINEGLGESEERPVALGVSWDRPSREK